MIKEITEELDEQQGITRERLTELMIKLMDIEFTTMNQDRQISRLMNRLTIKMAESYSEMHYIDG